MTFCDNRLKTRTNLIQVKASDPQRQSNLPHSWIVVSYYARRSMTEHVDIPLGTGKARRCLAAVLCLVLLFSAAVHAVHVDSAYAQTSAAQNGNDHTPLAPCDDDGICKADPDCAASFGCAAVIVLTEASAPLFWARSSAGRWQGLSPASHIGPPLFHPPKLSALN